MGDVVFEFPFGRIIDTGMACRRDGIIPPRVDLMEVHKEATAARAARKQQRKEEDRTIEAPRLWRHWRLFVAWLFATATTRLPLC